MLQRECVCVVWYGYCGYGVSPGQWPINQPVDGVACKKCATLHNTFTVCEGAIQPAPCVANCFAKVPLQNQHYSGFSCTYGTKRSHLKRQKVTSCTRVERHVTELNWVGRVHAQVNLNGGEDRAPFPLQLMWFNVNHPHFLRVPFCKLAAARTRGRTPLLA